MSTIWSTMQSFKVYITGKVLFCHTKEHQDLGRLPLTAF